MAEAFVRAGEPTSARPLLAEAGALAAALAVEQPDNASFAVLVATNRRYAARAAALDGQLDDACSAMREAIVAFERVIALDPATPMRIDATVTPWSELAELEERAGRLDAALEAGAHAIDAARECRRRDIDNNQAFSHLWGGLCLQSARLERVCDCATDEGRRRAGARRRRASEWCR